MLYDVCEGDMRSSEYHTYLPTSQRKLSWKRVRGGRKTLLKEMGKWID